MGFNYKKLRKELGQDARKATLELKDSLVRKHLRPDEFSIRQLFEHCVDDGAEMLAMMDPRRGGDGVCISDRISARQDGVSINRLMESDFVKSSNFANITGQIVYSALMEAYEAEDFIFSRLIRNQTTIFNGEKIAGVGGLGDKAEIVPEGFAYPMVGLGEDWIQTPPTNKRGFIVPITKEAIFFDRTGQILDKAREVGQSMATNKEKRAIDAVIDENTTAHRYNRKERGPVATYGDNSGSHDWDNLQASNGLVDWTDVDNAQQLFNSIVDPNTGEPIVTMGTQLIAVKALEATAMRLQQATQVAVLPGGYATSGTPITTFGPNPVAGAFTTVTSRLLASRLATDTDWFLGDVGRAVVYMENWPITVTEAPTNSELEFTHDIVQRFKVSERGQHSVREPRALVKNTT